MRQLKVTQSITSREAASLNKYLLEVSRIDLLTPEEETMLAGQIKGGDARAIDRLTKANLRFVVSVAKQYQYKGFPLTDLINEGNIGLIKAAQNFDETKGFKFISYAVWWIRQSIMQAINEKARIVRLPSNKILLYNKMARSTSLLGQRLEREPDTSEIALLLEVDEKEMMQLQGTLFHLSLDAPLQADEGNTMLEQLPAAEQSAADSGMNGKSLQIELKRCLSTLPQLQSQILQMFFGIDRTEPMSLGKIAAELELSEERIRQLKVKALGQLGSGRKRMLLQAYLS